MAAYRRVDDLTVTCRLTACTPGLAPGPTLGVEYGKPLPLPIIIIIIIIIYYAKRQHINIKKLTHDHKTSKKYYANTTQSTA